MVPALMITAKSVGTGEVGELSMTEPWINETTTDATTWVPKEERLVTVSEAMEELSTLIDTTVIGSEESRLVTTEIKKDTIPLTKSPTQIDEAGSFKAEVLITYIPLL